MEIQGKIIQVNEIQSGESARGTWKKREFIIETEGKYPKKVCIVLFGDAVDNFQVSQNEEVKASISVESREYNGRWYTDVKAWKVEQLSSTSSGNGDSPHIDHDAEEMPF